MDTDTVYTKEFVKLLVNRPFPRTKKLSLTLSLALKQRLRAIQKWPTVNCKYFVIHSHQGFSSIIYNTGWGTFATLLMMQFTSNKVKSNDASAESEI